MTLRIVRAHLALTVVMMLTGWASSADAQGVFKTGTFNKITTTGAQPPVAHGLGETPKALILWTSGSAVTGANSVDTHFAFGFADGPTSCGTCTSRSVSIASDHDKPNSDTERRIADKIISMGEYSVAAPWAEADLQSWDATNFTLNWTTNTTPGSVIHFIAIGGSAVSAKVVEWNTNTATGNQEVAVGFQPNVVLHAHIDSFATGTPPYEAGHAFLGLGAMDSDGDQWALSFYAQDGAGTSVTVRTQQPGFTIRTPTGYVGGGPLYQARALVPADSEGPTMTATGFKVKWTNVFGSSRKMVSLALAGMHVKVGSFNKITSGVSQQVPGALFQPTLVALASFQSTTMPDNLTMAHFRLGLGAADGTNQNSTAITDAHNENRTIVYAREDTSNVFLKSDSNTLAIEAAATLSTFDTDGFTLNWGTNDTVATEMLYIAFAPLDATAVELTALNATRYDTRVLVQWRTGFEIDNLGFHVYREVNGERTRVTQSLIAGSGLMAGQGTTVRAEQAYAVWDTAPEAADRSAVYWLEDVDFNGTSTWHGPVTPVAGGLQVPPEIATSAALRDLGKRAKRRGKVFVDRGAKVERPHKSDRPARSAAASDIDTQRALAAQAATKIGITHAGWYRVTQPELVAAGLPSDADPQTLRLFVDGVEQAMTVTGARDGRFDAGDAIEFYGTGLDTPYTDTRTYWLVASGRGGRRLAIHDAPARGGPANGTTSFPFTVQHKERSIYFAALRNGDLENWFGAFIYAEPTDLTLDVSNLDPSSAGELEIALQGVTTFADSAPDHRVGILVNGTEVGEVIFDGQSLGVQTFVLPAGTLIDGANTVTIVARGGDADYSLVDVVRLRYAHTYRADADLLRFTAEGPANVTIAGFASSAVRAIDITDPLAPEELRGDVGADAGLWAVTARVPGHGSRTLLAFSEATIATPAFVRANNASQWHASVNGADYLAVTHSQFAGRLAPLLERRARDGLSVAKVDIEDVYDEFSFGEKTPYALKDFVTHARTTWKTAPRFLLLVGDATLDPRDYAGLGDADFVPTKQIPMVQVALETASDDWFADADNDGLPELAVGRFSVRNAEQTETMVAKTLAYEDGDGTGWTNEVLLVAGANDEHADFEQSTVALHSLVPSGYTVQRVASGAAGVESARQQLLDAVTRGQLLVNFIGHGSVTEWGIEALLTTDDVANTWRNGGRLPLVVAMNCLNGFFHGIYDGDSLAETLLQTAGGGAVAAWASSGVTGAATQVRVNQQLFRVLFGNPTLTMAQAALEAKRVVGDRDVRRSWIFFGDPALRLKGVAKLPTPDTTSSQTSTAPTGVSSTSDSAIASSAAALSSPPIRLSDWNGDGRDDVFLHASRSWRLIFSMPSGERVQGGSWNAAWEVHPADLNGDQVADLVLVDRASSTMLHAINDGADQFAYTDGLLGQPWDLRVADLNGDRVDDLLLTMPDFGFWYTLLNDGRGHFTYHAGSWSAASSITLGDFNGDRRTDAFLYDPETGAWTMAFSDGFGDFTYAAGHSTAGSIVQRANVDGDQRADLLLYNPDNGAWAEWAAQERGQFHVRRGVWKAGLIVRAIDSTRSDRDDVLLYDPNSGEWTFMMNDKGDTTYANGIWRPQLTIATGDLNGDGRTDLFLYDPTTGVWIRGLRRERGSFNFTSGQWAPGWFLASRP